MLMCWKISETENPLGQENPLALQKTPLESSFRGSEKGLFQWFIQEQNEYHCDPNRYNRIKLDKQDINMFSHDNGFKYIIFPDFFYVSLSQKNKKK